MTTDRAPDVARGPRALRETCFVANRSSPELRETTARCQRRPARASRNGSSGQRRPSRALNQRSALPFWKSLPTTPMLRAAKHRSASRRRAQPRTPALTTKPETRSPSMPALASRPALPAISKHGSRHPHDSRRAAKPQGEPGGPGGNYFPRRGPGQRPGCLSCLSCLSCLKKRGRRTSLLPGVCGVEERQKETRRPREN